MSDELIEGYCDKCGKEFGDEEIVVNIYDNNVDGYRWMCENCQEECVSK